VRPRAGLNVSGKNKNLLSLQGLEPHIAQPVIIIINTEKRDR
jgi:hypothetical protein